VVRRAYFIVFKYETIFNCLREPRVIGLEALKCRWLVSVNALRFVVLGGGRARSNKERTPMCMIMTPSRPMPISSNIDTWSSPKLAWHRMQQGRRGKCAHSSSRIEAATTSSLGDPNCVNYVTSKVEPESTNPMSFTWPGCDVSLCPSEFASSPTACHIKLFKDLR
jgi:hypothetical protein